MVDILVAMRAMRGPTRAELENAYVTWRPPNTHATASTKPTLIVVATIT